MAQELDRESSIHQAMNILTAVDGLTGSTISQIDLLDRVAKALVTSYAAGYTAGTVDVAETRQAARAEGFTAGHEDGYLEGYDDAKRNIESKLPTA